MKKRRLIPQPDQEGARKKLKTGQTSTENTNKLVELEPFDSSLLPAEIVRHVVLQLNEDHDRLQIRLVCKTWFGWINLTAFTFGVIRSDEISNVCKILSRYTKPIGLNIKKSQLLTGDSLEPLWKLTNLTSLSINNLVSSVHRGISKLKNLSSLDVFYPDNRDLRVMTQLTRLTVSKFDLSFKLPNLESLYFDEVTPSIEAIAFSRLTELTIGIPKMPMSFIGTLVVDSPLKRLKVTLPEDFMSSLDTIYYKGAKLTALESLETDIMFDSDCLPLDTLTRFVAGSDASSYKMISHLTNIKELRVVDPEFDVIKSLTNLHKLETLAFTGNFLFGQRSLSYLPNPAVLTHLEMTFQNATKIEFEELTTLQNLKALAISSSGVNQTDLSFITVLSHLTLLSLECNEGVRKSLEWTTALTGLQRLHLAMPGQGDTTIIDHFSATNLTRLTYLFFRSVAQGVDLRGLTNLRELMLSNIKQHIDTPGLETLMNLTNIIMVHPMPEEQWQCLMQLTKLQCVYIEYEGKDADKKLESMTALKYLTSFMCMQSTWTGKNLSCLTTLQSITFGTKNPIAGDHMRYSEKLKDKMPYLYECTYFEDFMSRFSALWGK